MQFDRNWGEYKTGFGNIGGMFWIGLNKLHILAAPGRGAVLMIAIKPSDNPRVTFRAVYSTFEVASSTYNYRLKVAGYEGNAGDAMSQLNGMPFSVSENESCDKRLGGWWHQECSGNINSEYPMDANNGYRMRWANHNVMYSRMAIKYDD